MKGKKTAVFMLMIALTIMIMGCGSLKAIDQPVEIQFSQEDVKEDMHMESMEKDEEVFEEETTIVDSQINVELSTELISTEPMTEASSTETEENSMEANEADTESDLEAETAPKHELNEEVISSLQIAQKTSQLIVVSVESGKATLYMYQKAASDGWSTLVETDAVIGKNGIGKTKEGDQKTPRGAYSMSLSFGNKEDIGTALPYTKVDDSWYWVDDVNSAYYNRFVSTREVTCDWNSAEHISAVKNSYNYAIAIDYNTDCTKGAGSAIFLHCKPSGGAGCVAIDEDKMVTIMKNIQPGCCIIIDDIENITAY